MTNQLNLPKQKASSFRIGRNKLFTFLSQPYNIILIVMGVLCTITTVAPIVAILEDTIKIHPGTIDQSLTGKTSGYSFANYIDLFTGKTAKINLWTPLWNTIIISFFACVAAILMGGLFAFFVTRTNMKCKKYLSSIFIFPYIMPQWTLALVWNNLFNSNAVTGTSDGLLASLFGIHMPLWWCQGIFPCIMVLGMHYSAFAYILIGGIFRNMDANLEEAATILNTPKHRIVTRITLPMVKPAILSTVLLVFGSSMGSYPVPHYLKLSTLSTRYLEMNASRAGEASILAVLMMVIGIAIMILNQQSLKSRKNYTTVTGKSGQISKINLGVFKWIVAIFFIITTFMTSIYPLISFAFETFLPNPGDYSFLKTWNPANLTTKWWLTSENITENGLYGQLGMLYNNMIWKAYGGTILVSVLCALFAGTLGTLIGYAVSKKRRNRFANYVNNMAFLPYLMPSVAVGIAFFILLGTNGVISLYNTYAILVIVGTIKYIPFASRASLNSMLQLSGEIEESALIQNVPWFKRMFRIIIPIQKSSILSGFLLPFITCMRELSLFMLLCVQGFIISTSLDYFDEMGLAAFSSGMNLILIVTILIFNGVINKVTGASLDKGIGG